MQESEDPKLSVFKPNPEKTKELGILVEQAVAKVEATNLDVMGALLSIVIMIAIKNNLKEELLVYNVLRHYKAGLKILEEFSDA